MFVGMLLATQLVQAQYSSQSFSFQGYAIDGDNKALASTGISVKCTIYRTGTTYVEEHTTTSDAFGVFAVPIGQGTASSTITFGELNFNNFDFNLKVEVKETTGGTYAEISDKALSAVPYARSASNGVPVGTIVAFAGPDTAIPDGWLLCDGTAYNADANLKYAQLFAVIGITWGGSGDTDFEVPDLRGQFLRGLNTETSGADANRTLGSSQDEAFKSHNHNASSSSDGSHNHGAPTNAVFLIDDGAFTNASNTDSDSGSQPNLENSYTFSSAGAHSHTITVANSGGTETRPVNYAVNYIIKY